MSYNHWSQITITNKIMTKFETLRIYQNVTQKPEVSKCSWNNGDNRLVQHRVSTNLQFVKEAVSVKHNKEQ